MSSPLAVCVYVHGKRAHCLLVCLRVCNVSPHGPRLLFQVFWCALLPLQVNKQIFPSQPILVRHGNGVSQSIARNRGTGDSRYALVASNVGSVDDSSTNTAAAQAEW
jgi:hypothetical protein